MKNRWAMIGYFLAILLFSTSAPLGLAAAGAQEVGPQTISWPVGSCYGETQYPHRSSYNIYEAKVVGVTGCSQVSTITVVVSLLRNNIVVGSGQAGLTGFYVSAMALAPCVNGSYVGLSTHRVIWGGQLAYTQSSSSSYIGNCP